MTPFAVAPAVGTKTSAQSHWSGVLRLLAPTILAMAATCVNRTSADDAPIAPAAPSSTAPKGIKPSPDGSADDWAAKLFKSDPLSKISRPTIADFRKALADPKQAEHVLPRHLLRAQLPVAEQIQLLREALRHASLEVRRQAAHELQRQGLLEEVIGAQLLELAATKEFKDDFTVVLALQEIALPWSQVSDAYWQEILRALASDTPAASAAALIQLRRWGADAVPRLLDASQSQDKPLRNAAIRALAEVVGTARVAETKPEADEPPHGTAAGTRRLLTAVAPAPPPTVVAKAMPTVRTETHQDRKLDEEHPQTVRVYYGTNRELVKTVPEPGYLIYGLPVLLLFVLATAFRGIRKRLARKTVGGFLMSLFLFVATLGATAWIALAWNQEYQAAHTETVGVAYGAHREKDGGVHYGYCDVSIPPTHSVGEIERPLLGGEDETRHVMLRRNEELKEDAFFKQVRQVLAERAADERNCFIFVHGYNVTFEKAAMRTAQIHYDLNFRGVPMFYSWPSRANVRSYFSDRNEIFYSYEHIMRFLLATAERVDAKRVHVIAHSMGADAVSRAILAMGDRGKIFDQIILAAPDIDADVFRDQVQPRMQQLANRTTLYCSRNDWALHASYAFNDSARLGDSSRGIFVADGMDTVDASDIDTDLLGHSYYGDCLKLLNDVQLVIDRNLPPPERRLTSRAMEKLKYWTFSEESPRDKPSTATGPVPSPSPTKP